MENVKSDKKPSSGTRLWSKVRSPLLSAIREDVWGPTHRAILNDTLHIVQVMRERRRASKARGSVLPKETFESLVRRNRYTEAQLQVTLTAYLRVHWSMYAAACIGLIYALWLALTAGLLPAVAALVGVGGAAVHGYVYGYRAWQIRNRRLRTLADALCDIDTYFVL